MSKKLKKQVQFHVGIIGGSNYENRCHRTPDEMQATWKLLGSLLSHLGNSSGKRFFYHLEHNAGPLGLIADQFPGENEHNECDWDMPLTEESDIDFKNIDLVIMIGGNLDTLCTALHFQMNGVPVIVVPRISIFADAVPLFPSSTDEVIDEISDSLDEASLHGEEWVTLNAVLDEYKNAKIEHTPLELQDKRGNVDWCTSSGFVGAYYKVHNIFQAIQVELDI